MLRRCAIRYFIYCPRSFASHTTPQGLLEGDVEAPRYFAKIALPEVVPVLLQLLTRQDEDAEEGEWNVSMAAGTCLSFLAQAVHDPIVPAIIPFIEGNIKQENWHQREAAVMSFGSILVGPDPSVLTPLVNQALPLLINMMSDPQPQVKDTTAWTLGRICENLITSIKPDVHLHALVSALVAGLQDSPHIIANCCWALMNLADGLYELYDLNEEQSGGPLSPYFEGIVGALLQVTETCVIISPFISPACSRFLC
jgi:importin subunit beta-1